MGLSSLAYSGRPIEPFTGFRGRSKRGAELVGESLRTMSRLQACGRGVLWLWDHTVGWVVRVLLVIVIRTYQVTISPLLPPSCRFHPSCSAYGLQAVQVHGSAKGLGLAVWRLLRCNPWNKGGLDPVPDAGRWLPDIHPDGSPRRRDASFDDAMQRVLPDRRTT